MRALPKNIQDSISGLKSFYWCFEIDLISGDKLFLTSLDRVVSLSGVIYNPSSGLNVSEGIFNDSAQDNITLVGIYNDDGIDKNADLTDAKVKISIVMESSPYHLVSYYCTLYTKYDLHFTMFLEPESVKYNQTIVNVFSKTCRTKFGDEKCKVDKKLYSQDYTVVKMNIRSIEVSKILQEAGFYIGGDAHFAGHVFSAKILHTTGNVVQLDRVIPGNVKQYKSVKLSAGCDKKFITCCNKFNNAVNFRGEPFIPKYNFLKINQ
jgi:uncharacterized phage protein (TIGR02218 family)